MLTSSPEGPRAFAVAPGPEVNFPGGHAALRVVVACENDAVRVRCVCEQNAERDLLIALHAALLVAMYLLSARSRCKGRGHLLGVKMLMCASACIRVRSS